MARPDLLTCVHDCHRPPCLSMVRRRSTEAGGVQSQRLVVSWPSPLGSGLAAAGVGLDPWQFALQFRGDHKWLRGTVGFPDRIPFNDLTRATIGTSVPAHVVDLQCCGEALTDLRTSRGSIGCCGGLRADGEDLLGCDSGADRALLPAWVAQHRALGVGAQPRGGRGTQRPSPHNGWSRDRRTVASVALSSFTQSQYGNS
jgi:hypothetical protein